jgi:hypothetical protein
MTQFNWARNSEFEWSMYLGNLNIKIGSINFDQHTELWLGSVEGSREVVNRPLDFEAAQLVVEARVARMIAGRMPEPSAKHYPDECGAVVETYPVAGTTIRKPIVPSKVELRMARQRLLRAANVSDYYGLSYEQASIKAVAICIVAAQTGATRNAVSHLVALTLQMDRLQDAPNTSTDRGTGD